MRSRSDRLVAVDGLRCDEAALRAALTRKAPGSALKIHAFRRDELIEAKQVIIATGSEVSLALGAREKLNAAGIATRVVSMPCWEFFDAQPQKYKDAVLPPSVKARYAVEAGVSQGWHKYIGDAGDMLSVDRFGESAPADDIFRSYGFTVDNIVKAARKLVR